MEIDKAIQLISSCRNGVAFTGSGISAESGISTYRDTGGLWDKYKEGTSGGMLAVLANHPEDAPEILSGFVNNLMNARPNAAHWGLAEMEKMGFIKGVITQNVDNLHKEAGNTDVFELHGNMFRQRCMQCGRKMPINKDDFLKIMEKIIEKLKTHGLEEIVKLLPKCSCGGFMRFDFVSFGEQVQNLDQAIQASSSCDLMLIIGTSGVVYPAASLPIRAKECGAILIEINPKDSEFKSLCDLFLQARAGDIFPLLISGLKKYKAVE